MTRKLLLQMAVPGSRSAMGKPLSGKRFLADDSGSGFSKAAKLLEPPLPPGPPPCASRPSESLHVEIFPESRIVEKTGALNGDAQRRLFVGNLEMTVTEGDILKVRASIHPRNSKPKYIYRISIFLN